VPNDLNDIWMKFAYGDDNSEELLLDVFKEAAHQAAVELRPSIRSVSVDEPVETVATCGTEQSPVVYERTNDVVSSRSSSESHIATQGTTVSEPALSNAATVGSSNEPSRNVTRFVMPKSFVGKHINEYQDAIARDFMANAPTDGRKNRGKGGKKKKKKMAIDGRTDIRSLPDFDGDPIEEIEDD
jgi:hypothetical protein